MRATGQKMAATAGVALLLLAANALRAQTTAETPEDSAALTAPANAATPAAAEEPEAAHTDWAAAALAVLALVLLWLAERPREGRVEAESGPVPFERPAPEVLRLRKTA